jgi:subtilase family serine protease
MRGRLLTCFVTVVLVVLLAGLSVPAGAASGRVALKDSTASWAGSLQPLRHSDPGTEIQIAARLGFGDPAGAEAAVRDVSDPASPDHGRFLSAADALAAFSPSAEQAEAVGDWLASQGLEVTNVAATRTFVSASGTVAEIEKAFAVTLNDYRVGGEIVRAPAGVPSAPEGLGIRGVAGLTSLEASPAQTPPYPPLWKVGRPCSNYWAEKMATDMPKAYGRVQPYTICGYTPAQMQGAYGWDDVINAGYDGSGFTVAVIDAFAAPTMQADLDQYSLLHGLPQLTITEIVDPPNQATLSHQQGWWGEEALDIEAVHTMAPGADILYRGAAGGGGAALLVALDDVIGNHRANEVTNSWGYLGEQKLPLADMNAFNDIFAFAAITGIGVCFSSGDDGDEASGAGYPTADFPASSPYVTAVGGTSLGVGAVNDRIWETGWGTYWSGLSGGHWSPKPPGIFWYGGGGGTSRVFGQPWYQAGVVPDSLSGRWGGTARVVPDIAMDGDPNTGFLVGETQSFPDGSSGYAEYRIGGTSLSSPLFAGVMAVVDDFWNAPHGLANPWIYGLDETDALHDIVDPAVKIAAVRADFNNGRNAVGGKSFSLRTMNMDTSLEVMPGFDDVTGLGTPNGWAFVTGFVS